MYSKKKTNKLKRQFIRDNALGLPGHKSDDESVQRHEFLNQLRNSSDFRTVNKQNEKKFEDSWRKIVKQFGAFDYIIILCFAASSLLFSYVFAHDAMDNHPTVKAHKYSTLALFATLGILFGTGIGVGCSVSLRRATKENSVESLYSRLSVRLFDLMREKYPDLDEKILKAANPEMARVIKALLMTNIPENDTREIVELATKLAKRLRDLPSKKENEYNILANCNEYIDQVVSIVEQNMLANPALHDALLGVYRGAVPLKFAVNNSEKTK